ncbi:MAG: hypothetical protein QXJ17_02665 [Nitrososphaeria archaeon]
MDQISLRSAMVWLDPNRIRNNSLWPSSSLQRWVGASTESPLYDMFLEKKIRSVVERAKAVYKTYKTTTSRIEG